MNVKTALIAAALCASISSAARADGELTGDTKLACEAILCLATGAQPPECRPSIEKFFSIQYKYIWDTLTGRTNFLDLCPTASSSDDMKALSKALANGSGRCDAASFNSQMINYGMGEGPSSIGNVMPPYCATLYANKYVRLSDSLPVYVGNPADGGFWADASQYKQALAGYNAQIAARNAQRAIFSQAP